MKGKWTLETAMQGFIKHCKLCQKRLVVHAHRPKSKRKTEAVYAHCETENCALRNKELAF